MCRMELATKTIAADSTIGSQRSESGTMKTLLNQRFNAPEFRRQPTPDGKERSTSLQKCLRYLTNAWAQTPSSGRRNGVPRSNGCAARRTQVIESKLVVS